MSHGSQDGSLTLLTGGSGHLGANLVRRLLADGHRVRCLVRPTSDNRGLDGLEVERVPGDLRDFPSLQAAVRGCARVFHCAARLSTAGGGEHDIYQTNVIGSRNLLRAAREEKVKRVVVTGSFSAVGHRPDRASDEDVPFNPFEKALPYEHTKVLVELECLRAVVEGLDVVVATSCAIIGPSDYKPSRMGQTLLDFARGRMPAYIPGGFEFVSARDVAEGHVLAMDKGRTGQKYIFASEYVAVDDLMRIMEEVSGHARPRLRLPAPVMAAIAAVTSPILTTFFPRVHQRLTPAAVRLLRMGRHADCTKAKRELGYRPTTIAAALREAHDDFVRRGLLPANPRRAAASSRPGVSVADAPPAERGVHAQGEAASRAIA